MFDSRQPTTVLTFKFQIFSDPRTANWFLVKSFTPLFTILVSYVYFCKYAGPRYMRDRKPFQLKNVIIFYNAFQVIGSAYLVYEGLNSGWLTSYNLSCQPVIYEDTPEARRVQELINVKWKSQLKLLLFFRWKVQLGSTSWWNSSSFWTRFFLF